MKREAAGSLDTVAGWDGGITSTLWSGALAPRPKDADAIPRERLRSAFFSMRAKAKDIAGEIHAGFPEYTVHDVTHLDALWDIADSVAGPSIVLNPAEAFVLGGAMLVHDLAMGAAAYEDGVVFRESAEYKDILGMIRRQRELIDDDDKSTDNTEEADKVYLREYHATKAETLPTQGWHANNDDRYYLIDNEELREFYGPLIGRIAASHWWPFSRARDEFRDGLGSLGTLRPSWPIDALQLAALLRISDAAQLDTRRAPLFLRVLRDISGDSAKHWDFQGRFARPQPEGNRLKYTGTRVFSVAEADAWWLAFDAISMVNRELRAVDDVFTMLKHQKFKVKGVLGADDAAAFSEYVKPSGWFPIDARPHVRDIPSLIGRLGGAELYGDTARGAVVIRELLQNAIDATKAFNEVCVGAASDTIHIEVVDDGKMLTIRVADHGVGMSRDAITDGLLDFGTSYWTVPAIRRDIPGLLASNFTPSGKFGIGFFSVFMLTARVQVRTLAYRGGPQDTIVVDFADGLRQRPVVRKALENEFLWRPGTIVELRDCPRDLQSYLIEADKTGEVENRNALEIMAELCEFVAPFSNLNIKVTIGTDAVTISALDPIACTAEDLIHRARGPKVRAWYATAQPDKYPELISEVRSSSGALLGRAGCALGYQIGHAGEGAMVSRNGMRIASLENVQGFFYGYPTRAARDAGKIEAEFNDITTWAAGQVGRVLAGCYSSDEQLRCAEWALSLKALPDALPIAESSEGFHNRDSVIEWASRRDTVVLLSTYYVEEGEHFEEVLLDEYVIVTGAYSNLGRELIDGVPLYVTKTASQFRGWSAASVVIECLAIAWNVPLSELDQLSLCPESVEDEDYTAFVGRYAKSKQKARRRIIGAFSRQGYAVSSKRIGLLAVESI